MDIHCHSFADGVAGRTSCWWNFGLKRITRENIVIISHFTDSSDSSDLFALDNCVCVIMFAIDFGLI